MTVGLERLPASYLDASFIGQVVVVPGSASQATVSGVLSDVVLYRRGPQLRLVAARSALPVLVRFEVYIAHVDLFLAGLKISVLPTDVVLVEPAPSPVDRP